MNTVPTPSHRVSDQDNATVTARLAATEKHLDEIIRRLDEIKDLLTLLDDVPPSHQYIVEG